MLKPYVILSLIDGDLQAWYVDLPDEVLEPYETDGWSDRGSVDEVLKEVSEYFDNQSLIS